MYSKLIRLIPIIIILSGFAAPCQLFAQVSNISITIHLRGVSESKISLMSASGTRTIKPIVEVQSVKNGEATTIQVPRESLPGEFVLRFDYKEKKESTPYPSEKSIFISNQNLELWVSPIYCNNADSTWFQKGEKENAAFALFSKENGRQKEKIGLLQQFLMNYDDQKSKFYKLGTEEYEQRRQAYNLWLDAQVRKDKALFVSSLYRYQYVPQIPWEGSETERMKSVIKHYFDGIDLNDSILIRTSDINKWMDSYVNLYGQMATSMALRDSLLPVAATTAIEKAKSGHPLVYGWMVDYFFKGFESNNIPSGTKALEPYMNDPNCPTSKRKEIERRLTGMQTLVKGSKAPDVVLNDKSGNRFTLYEHNPATPFTLLVFWSADCSHCVETVNALYPWCEQTENKQNITVVAVSLDETESEVKAWELKTGQLNGWKHLRAVEGVRSKVANDYYILATPVMVLIDSKTRNIIALPNNVKELVEATR